MESNSGIERNWLVSVNRLNIYYSPESKTMKSDRLQMAMIASEIKQKLHVDVQVGGAEAEAAIQGALTTPGTTRPLAILDLGAGSTDASIINQSGEIVATHLAGAGDMVTMIIARELGLNDRYLAEEIKKYPLAKVESLLTSTLTQA